MSKIYPELKGAIQEIRAGEVLIPKTSEELAWNNASERAINIVQRYIDGNGLFQITEGLKK